MRASRYDHAGVVKALLKVPDLDINQANDYGDTALIMASHYGHAGVVEELIKVPNLDINQANEDGHTALTRASWNGHTDVVEALLKVRARNINQANHEGQKPIDVADNDEIKAMLRQALEQQETQRKDEAKNKERREEEAAAARKQAEQEAWLLAEAMKVPVLTAEEEAARHQQEAQLASQQKRDALFLTATTNFISLTAEQIADLVVTFGEPYALNQYAAYRENILWWGLTGALVVQSLDDNDLSDNLKAVGVTSELHLKDIEAKLRVYAFPMVADTSTATLINRTGQHVMISYCPAQKVIVTVLAVYLREKHGYDVWMDDVGSTVCGKMEGGDSEKKRAEAEAVEAGSVSPKESVNDEKKGESMMEIETTEQQTAAVQGMDMVDTTVTAGEPSMDTERPIVPSETTEPRGSSSSHVIASASALVTANAIASAIANASMQAMRGNEGVESGEKKRKRITPTVVGSLGSVPTSAGNVAPVIKDGPYTPAVMASHNNNNTVGDNSQLSVVPSVPSVNLHQSPSFGVTVASLVSRTSSSSSRSSESPAGNGNTHSSSHNQSGSSSETKTKKRITPILVSSQDAAFAHTTGTTIIGSASMTIPVTTTTSSSSVVCEAMLTVSSDGVATYTTTTST